MRPGVDAAALLERALVRSGASCGVAVEIVESRATRWASATFSGDRHALELRCIPPDRGAAWLTDLAEAELPLRGHLVADLAVVGRTRSATQLTATIEALTVVER